MSRFIKKPVVTFIVIALIIVGIIYFESKKPKITSSVADRSSDLVSLSDEILSPYQKAPDFVGIERWINSVPLSIEQLKGKVVLVDFWTYTCINCIRTLPYVKAWDEKYRDKGLVIVGVHTPEFNFEKNYDNVVNAVNKYGLKYAVAQDNDYATWSAYQNRYWPRKYLIDIDGRIRYDHAGEGGYEETEKVIQQLLNERMERLEGKGIDFDMSHPENITSVSFEEIGTPELYFGYKFVSRYFGNSERFNPDEIVDYSYPKQIEPNNFYLVGKWRNNKDNMELASDEGVILLWYKAKVVNIVAGSGNSSDIGVVVDNLPVNETNKGNEIATGNSFEVNDFRLYNAVSNDLYEPHVLKLFVKGKGFKIFTFTFG